MYGLICRHEVCTTHLQIKTAKLTPQALPDGTQPPDRDVRVAIVSFTCQGCKRWMNFIPDPAVSEDRRVLACHMDVEPYRLVDLVPEGKEPS